jgi:hypothetical protein
MSIAEFSRRIELHFWDWAIPTLSASRFVHKGVRIFYRTFRKAAFLRRYLIGSGLAVLGFSNGMFIYWLLAR